jgi:uncharacterized protein with NRDE domain
MCLAIIAHAYQKDWPLILVANRDELHARPANTAEPWPWPSAILAGRDLEAGGTWLGVSRHGRIGLLTNHRDPERHDPDAPSRGHLTEDYLNSNGIVQDYAQTVQKLAKRYNGFNLLIGDGRSLAYISNRAKASPQLLAPGIIGVSNAELQTPWPKLVNTRNAVAAHLASQASPDPQHLISIMQKRQIPPDEELPATGVGLERERLLASPFILNERYGTRCTTVVMQRNDGMMFFYEQSYSPNGQLTRNANWRINTYKGSVEPLTEIKVY